MPYRLSYALGCGARRSRPRVLARPACWPLRAAWHKCQDTIRFHLALAEPCLHTSLGPDSDRQMQGPRVRSPIHVHLGRCQAPASSSSSKVRRRPVQHRRATTNRLGTGRATSAGPLRASTRALPCWSPARRVPCSAAAARQAPRPRACPHVEAAAGGP